MVTIATTAERLAEFARLMNEWGAESAQADDFLSANRADAEFVELAELSRQLKLELQPEPNRQARS
jgi:hypothetical protein